MMVFVGEDLKELDRRLMKKFVKKDVLDEADSPAKLASLNLKTADNFVPEKKTDVGVAIAPLLAASNVSDFQILQLYNGAQNFLKALDEKILEKALFITTL